MCDEFTSEADESNLARRGLTRREFAALGASAALAGCAASTGGDALAEASSDASGLVERSVEVRTEEGTLDAFFVHPAERAHPGVIMWPDVVGLRESKKVMARLLAAEGYAVLVANQYYRGAYAPILKTFVEWRTPEGQALVSPLRRQITAEGVTRDAKAIVSFLDGEDAVDKGRGIGSCGYCMGGSFAVRTAASVPDRVRAAASFHGGRLATAGDDSPHRLIATTQASYLFAIARNDDEKGPEAKGALREAADAAGRDAEIEVYAADHGWCVPDSPSWNEEEASRARGRMLALFETL